MTELFTTTAILTVLTELIALVLLLALFVVVVTRDPDKEQRLIRATGILLLAYVHVLHQLGYLTLFATIVWSCVSVILIGRTFVEGDA